MPFFLTPFVTLFHLLERIILKDHDVIPHELSQCGRPGVRTRHKHLDPELTAAEHRPFEREFGRKVHLGPLVDDPAMVAVECYVAGRLLVHPCSD
jgi:hypothetical protein